MSHHHFIGIHHDYLFQSLLVHLYQSLLTHLYLNPPNLLFLSLHDFLYRSLLLDNPYQHFGHYICQNSCLKPILDHYLNLNFDCLYHDQSLVAFLFQSYQRGSEISHH